MPIAQETPRVQRADRIGVCFRPTDRTGKGGRRWVRATLLAGLFLTLAMPMPAGRSQDPPPAAEAAAEIVADTAELPFDLDEALEHLDDLYRSGASIALVEMTIVKPRISRTMTMKAWSAGTDRSLVLITAPARDSGSATLKVGTNLWSYQPRIRRTIRVPPSMMLSSWMGSDFTHDDMVREYRMSRDYDARSLGKSATGDGWDVELTAKPDVVGLWKRVVYTVSEDGTLPLRARYYDRRDRLSRIMTFDELRDLGGQRLPAHMVLQPLDKDGEPKEDQRTEMRYLELDLDADVPESTFSLSRLEQLR